MTIRPAVKRGQQLHAAIEALLARQHPIRPRPVVPPVDDVFPGDVIMIASLDDEQWAFTSVAVWPPDLVSVSVMHMLFRQACFLVTGVWSDKRFLPGCRAVKLLAYDVVKVKDPVMMSFSRTDADREINNGDIYITNSEVLETCRAQLVYRASHGD